MNSKTELIIDNKKYFLMDEINNISVSDSFVAQQNKLAETTGNGEAKMYIASVDRAEEFFDNGDIKNGFLFKRDLLEYLDDASFEYEEQEQGYRKNIFLLLPQRKNKIREFEKNIINFEFKKAEVEPPRYYINSEPKLKTRNYEIYKNIFRGILLPNISHITIQKIKDNKNNIFYYFKPILDYSYNSVNHPSIIKKEEEKIRKDETLQSNERKSILQSRKGQGKFRSDLLEISAECIITKVNDKRVIIASHIKPWVKSNNKEKLDPLNGLPLTPTYDKLFDQGFITFEDDGELKISDHISPLNVKKLNIKNGTKYIIPKINERMEYLKYHRTEIFKNGA